MATYTRQDLDNHRSSRHAVLSEDEIAQEWVNEGGDPRWAVPMSRIAKRESGGKVRINNRGLNKNGTVDWGLFQINDVWRSDPVIGPMFKSGALLTAKGATRAAIRILKVQGPKAWATYDPATDDKYLDAFKGGARPKTYSAPTKPTATPPTLTPGGEKTDTHAAVQAALLDPRKKMSLLGRIQSAISSGQYTTTTAPTVTPGSVTPGTPSTAAAPSGAASGAHGDIVSRADAISRKKLPYLWGGGHGGKVDPYKATPLDCSGAVSAILGINPRVAAQFKTWGAPGRDPAGKLTIYAKDSHVLAEINGHFWGTSAANPGGGAGWIPRAQISKAYLAGFTARHG